MQSPDDGDSLLTPQEVADLLRVRRSWVYAAARNGEIPHLRLGRHIRFRRTSLDAWLSTRERPAVDPMRPARGDDRGSEC